MFSFLVPAGKQRSDQRLESCIARCRQFLLGSEFSTGIVFAAPRRRPSTWRFADGMPAVAALVGAALFLPGLLQGWMTPHVSSYEPGEMS